MTTVSVTMQIDPQRLNDILVGAVEGGSNYWAGFRVIEGKGDDYTAVLVTEYDTKLLDKDGKVVKDTDLALGVERLSACATRGCKYENGEQFEMAAQHLADFMSGNDDAITADVILQMTLFNEVVYG